MKDQPQEFQPPMADSISYSSPVNTYLPPASSYYPNSHSPGHVHVVSQPPRSEPQQRKRPKYTRSKTGCLTCRVKKIKCDETKPMCMRCTHGQRDCNWPEGVPTRKKATPRKESVDGRPSTAESGLSETSTPPTRDNTPPRRPQPAEYSLPPVVARRHSEPFVPPLGPDPELPRRQIAPNHYVHHPSPPMNLIPEMSQYQSTRYDAAYGGNTHMHTGAPRLPGHSHPSSHSLHMRPMTHQHQSQHYQSQHHSQHHQSQHHQSQHHHHPQPTQHWSQPMLPPLNPPLNPMDTFLHTNQERSLVGHSSNDHHARYQ